MKPYTYILVRGDLSPAQQMVQACHAALEAGFAFSAPAETSSLITLSVPDKAALLAAQARLEAKGIRTLCFFEPDFDMGFSALATCPLYEKKERFALAKYPLFGKEARHATA